MCMQCVSTAASAAPAFAAALAALGGLTLKHRRDARRAANLDPDGTAETTSVR